MTLQDWRSLLQGRKISLVATDLDGTLLRSDKSIAPATKAAIAAAVDAGICVVTNSGRALTTLPPDIHETRIEYAVVSNGALGFDYRAERVLFMEKISVETQRALVGYIKEILPEVYFGVSRGIGELFVGEAGYVDLMPADDWLYGREIVRANIAEVVAEPTIKMVAQHADLAPDALLRIFQQAPVSGFHVTTSGAPFVEIAAAGVTKATGLAALADILGIARSEVVAVGDAKNDLEMLRWAGVGAAMDNALAEVKTAADIVLPSNDADGLAQLLDFLY